jgi:Na+/H+-translocating membrane pyrophosphatase
MLCVLTAIFPPSAVLQDTSGPSLNILMKLMAIISLVFADFFFAIK